MALQAAVRSRCGRRAAQGAIERVPAVPLVAHDPYFSVWAMYDKLTDGPTKHWTGSAQPMDGLIRIDGKKYRFMGDGLRDVPAMRQTGLEMTPTHTLYTFEAGGVRCVVSFLCPLLPEDLSLMARPVTYLSWHLTSTDAAPHTVRIFFDVDPRIAVNSPDQNVTWGRSIAMGLQVLNVGSQDQRVLNRSGDDLRADWGYFHLAVPVDEASSTVMSRNAMRSFASDGELAPEDDTMTPKSPNQGAAFAAVEFPVTVDGKQGADRHVLLSFTQDCVIEYLDRRLKPYWAKDGKTEGQMLSEAETEYAAVEKRAAGFDSDLTADLERTGGKVYARLATLAFRQTLAANGLAADVDGTPLQFPKENFSNGCIATVDVLYPSAPFFLFFNPVLLEAQLKPVMEYATGVRWKWPFAPHDLGQYPLADGQVYGGGERTEEDQMPVEESGNMLLMIAALARAGRYALRSNVSASEESTLVREVIIRVLRKGVPYCETSGRQSNLHLPSI